VFGARAIHREELVLEAIELRSCSSVSASSFVVRANLVRASNSLMLAAILAVTSSGLDYRCA